MSDADRSRVAASVKQRLLNLSTHRREDFNLVLTRYALERFLRRLTCSPHRNTLILKGAMLFELWNENPHRATRDMDFLAQGETGRPAIEAKIREICSVQLDEPDDGLTFNVANLAITEIRDDDHYGGLRAKFTALLGTARIPIQLDFGIGDAITPGPIEADYPSLLSMTKPNVLAYPRDTVVAEKLEAIVNLGMDNSRMKDFFDLWFIFTTFEDDPTQIATAVARTFDRRGQALPEDIPIGLSDEFATNPSKFKQWQAFITRAVEGAPSLNQVITVIRAVSMPIFEAARTATS